MSEPCVVLELQRCAGLLLFGPKGGAMQTTEEIRETRLELKYCEGCGALHLRMEGSEHVYCRSCWKVLREIAGGRGRDRRQA